MADLYSVACWCASVISMQLLHRNRIRALPALGLVHLNLGLTLSAAGIFTSLVVLALVRAHSTHNLHQVACSIKQLLAFEDCTAIHEALTSIADEVLVARVLDSRQLLAKWPKNHLIAQLELLDVILPISHGNAGLIGNDGRCLLLGVVGVICLALSALFCWLTERKLTSIISTLRDIADVTRVVRRDRNLGLRVTEMPIAELYELTSTFNGLLCVLEVCHNRLKQENELLEHRATHDSLTGLRNRAFFENQLECALKDIVPSKKWAVLFIDGNRIKEVNDTFGHVAGDAVLVAIAGRIRAQLREGDLVARLGGDEFAVLAPIRFSGDVLQIAGKITGCMAQPVILSNDRPVVISVSVGIALWPDHASTPRGLLQAADEAMYEAKHRCKGGWRMATYK